MATRKKLIYITGLTKEGKPLLGGLFRIKDEAGFPLDMSYFECKEKGCVPDWAEALADAGRQGIVKFDAVVKELGYLLDEPARDEIVEKFQLWVKQLELPFEEACEAIFKIKKSFSPCQQSIPGS